MARILIVEDEPINAEVAGVICEAAGHQVRHAANGLEALERLAEAPFDLVLADVIMPRMDGLSLARAIRQSSAPYAAIPIMGVTATAGKDELAAMIGAGMDQVLTKPFRNASLRQAIASAITSPLTITLAPPLPVDGSGSLETRRMAADWAER